MCFCCQDNLELMNIAGSTGKRTFNFGLSEQAQIYPKDIKMKDNLSCFNCVYRGQILGQITLKIPGRHNICNALAAIALGLELELDFNSIQEALKSYNGVKRRQQLKFKEKGILIFDDYAHHPTEIKATLESLRSFGHKRVLAVFQPHRYTRTKFLIEDFGNCFQGIDSLIVTDIYAAAELPIEGINARDICHKAQEANVKNVRFLPKQEIVKYLLAETRPGDLIAIMGAGDIGDIADVLVEKIKRSHTL